jgi:hypothetical protein
MSNPIQSLIITLLLEGPGRKMSLAQHAERFERSGQDILKRAQSAAPTPANRETLAHITGLERWGQRRLRSFLGQPPAADEYDGYRPGVNLEWTALQAEFAATRQATVDLARELDARQVRPDARVDHNQFGGLTATGWLQYLRQHAGLESKKIK